MPTWKPAGLKRRADFVTVQTKGLRQRGTSLILLTHARGLIPRATPPQTIGLEARIGLVVSRRVGHAVCRNRVKRRLRAIARHCEESIWQPGVDYVLIAHPSAASLSYDALKHQVMRLLRHRAARIRQAPTPQALRPRA